MDPRTEKLAGILVGYSTAVKAGDRVLISSANGNEDLVKALVREVYKAGGQPFTWMASTAVERELAMGYTAEQLDLRAKIDAALMDEMQCFIGFSGVMNKSEMSDVPAEKMNLYARHYNRPVHGLRRVPKTRWVVLRYPTPAMAQAADMSTEAFEDYFYQVCTMDYSRMDKAMDPLKEWMERTDRVRIKGPGTELTFSIKGLPAVKCSGQANIPDGELFTAPVKDSIEGVLTYNTPSTHDGFTFRDICLRFEKGKIVEATANDTARINHILDQDEGARYVGEFSFGLNPYILTPMDNTLFDEKIMGSFHFTPGCSYDECDNGNKSSLHWDLVAIQTPQMGGGEIWFDGVLIRKDGRFVPEALQGLNPENLM